MRQRPYRDIPDPVVILTPQKLCGTQVGPTNIEPDDVLYYTVGDGYQVRMVANCSIDRRALYDMVRLYANEGDNLKLLELEYIQDNGLSTTMSVH